MSNVESSEERNSRLAKFILGSCCQRNTFAFFFFPLHQIQRQRPHTICSSSLASHPVASLRIALRHSKLHQPTPQLFSLTSHDLRSNLSSLISNLVHHVWQLLEGWWIGRRETWSALLSRRKQGYRFHQVPKVPTDGPFHCRLQRSKVSLHSRDRQSTE